MAAEQKIIAVGLLTTHDLAVLGQALRRFYPVRQPDPAFAKTIQAIDAANIR